MAVRARSKHAWKVGSRSGSFGQRSAAILRRISHRRRCTERQIKNDLKLAEMNYVRPRVTELIYDGLVREVSSTTCPVTSRPVRVLELTSWGRLVVRSLK